MDRLLRLLCCLILACAAMVHHEWETSYKFKSTDCVRKLGDEGGHKITYEQAAGLASAPLVWVGELQPLLINSTLPECEPDAEPFTYNGEDDDMMLMFGRKARTLNSTLPDGGKVMVGRGMAARTFNSTLPDGGKFMVGRGMAARTFNSTLPDAELFTYNGEDDGMVLMFGGKVMVGRGMAARTLNSTLPDAEPFTYNGEDDGMMLMFGGKVMVGRGMAARTLNSTLPDAEPFTYNGEDDDMMHMFGGKVMVGRGMAARTFNSTLPDAEPFTYNGEDDDMMLMFGGKVKVGRGMAARSCNATLPECTCLSALSFEIEDGNGRLIGYPAAAVPSGSPSSGRPPMGYLQYGVALVVVMLLLGEFFATLYLATGRDVADQNPATAGGTIAMSAPAPSASGSLPVGGGHSPPPSPASASSPSSDDPAGTSTNNSSGSGTLSAPPSEGEEPASPPPSGDPAGTSSNNPSGSGTLSTPPSAPDNEVLRSSILLGFLAFGTATVVGIFSVGFDRILGGWSRGTKVVYKVSTWLDTISLGLAAAFMVAWYKASSASRNPKLLSISEFCAKLSVILSINLLVVIFPCTLGRGACVAAIPSVAVITLLIATAGIWGRVIIGILGQRRQTQLAGDAMA